MRLIIILITMLISINATAQEYQTHFPPDEFSARWEKVFDSIGKNAVAIVQGAPDPGGYIYPRQSNEFYYLCGVENSYSYILLDGRTKKVTLYISDESNRGWERVLSLENPEKIKEMTGVDEVMNIDELKNISAQIIYTPFSPAEGQGQSRGELNAANSRILEDFWDGRVSREAHFISLLLARNSTAEIRNLTPILDDMRSIKSPREIEVLRRAGQLAALGLVEAMRSTKSGIYEYQLDAVARYIYLVNDSRLEGYRSITAAGVSNISDPHYYYNSSKLKDGDLVLMDYAPDYGYYTSDIGRMWPVNGKFNDQQRELCQIILDYHKAILSRIRPGVTADQIMDEAKELMEPIIERTNFSKPIYEQTARHLVETGGGVFSHNVGMAVHDVGDYRSGPLKVGQVFSVDPIVRIPEEGLYMRIEDTVVVTEEGNENLTRFAPSELDEIEKMIQESGILQFRPATVPVYK